MKKMIMLLVAIASAFYVNAASMSWSLNLGKDGYANKTYYVIDGAKQADVLALLGAVDDSTASSLNSMAFTSGTLSSKKGAATIDTNVGSATTAMLLVLDGELAAGQTYKYETVDISAGLYTPPATAPATPPSLTALANSGTMVKAGGGGDVPEPTSGLLLLVGGAMLALRRKQK